MLNFVLDKKVDINLHQPMLLTTSLECWHNHPTRFLHLGLCSTEPESHRFWWCNRQQCCAWTSKSSRPKLWSSWTFWNKVCSSFPPAYLWGHERTSKGISSCSQRCRGNVLRKDESFSCWPPERNENVKAFWVKLRNFTKALRDLMEKLWERI